MYQLSVQSDRTGLPDMKHLWSTVQVCVHRLKIEINKGLDPLKYKLYGWLFDCPQMLCQHNKM